MKQYNKAYINDIELEFASEVIKRDFRRLGRYEVGDAVVWDSEIEIFRVAPPESIELLDTDRYTPTGVIVIPSSHNVYGTGEAGVMALLSASLGTPDTGQVSNVGMYWGADKTDYPELNNYNACSSYGMGNTWTQVQLVPGTSYLPSDQSPFGEKLLNPNGEQNSWYYYQNNYHTSSPYNIDGSRNHDYYNTEIGANNALSDLNGRSNTEFLCSKATAQSDWRTGDSVTDRHTEGYHPAACACWRFHTIGTNQGDWYLPACGELGYVCVRFKKINETIDMLQSHFGIALCKLLTSIYFASSEYDSRDVRGINFSNGLVTVSAKGGAFYLTRPFTRLK